MTRHSEAANSSCADNTGDTVPAMLARRAASAPGAIARWELDKGGQWRSSSWLQALHQAKAVALGLRQLGVTPGGLIGLMASSCAGWDDCSMGVLAARGVVVGIDAHATAAQVAALCVVAPLTGLIVENTGLLSRFGQAQLASIAWIVVMDGTGMQTMPAAPVCISLQSLLIEGATGDLRDWDISRSDDPALMVFTSGTTGTPKAILYRHAQVCAAVFAILGAFDDIQEGSRLACWLPLSNLFQRIINLCAVERGAQTYYVIDPREVMQHLTMIRPHIFIGVPRFYEKLHQGLVQQIQQAPGWQRRIGLWAMAIGQQHAQTRREGRSLSVLLTAQHHLADRILFRKIRASLGGALQYFVSGSAPMPLALLDCFCGMGLPVMEAYGQSECIVPVAANRPGAARSGTVGQPLHGVEVRLAEDGQLMVRSSGVFEGYRQAGVQTAAVDSDGWLCTGDLAEIDADGFVRLVGRQSEVFKTSTGRQVAPAAIEALLCSVPWIEHAAVFGSGQKSLVAVVSVSAALVTSDSATLRQEVQMAVSSLPVYLRPTGLIVTHRPFSISTGELTSNLKLRRHQVAIRYAAHLQHLRLILFTDVVPANHSLAVTSGESVEMVVL